MWEDKERMKRQTQEHLDRMPIARMKHFDGRQGMCSHRDGEYRLIEDGAKIKIVFGSIDELSDAGWTID